MSINKKKLVNLGLLKNTVVIEESKNCLNRMKNICKSNFVIYKKRMYWIKSSSFNEIRHFIFAHSIQYDFIQYSTFTMIKEKLENKYRSEILC